VDEAVGRAERLGTGTVVVRNAHHIACLAAFLTRATDRGMMVILASSDPSVASVAPFGGTRAVFTPNPIAVGIPTGGDPVLIDVSTSVTTNGMSGRLRAEGRRFGHPWLLDAEGNPSDDPAVLYTEPPGTILPVGGLDHGHKGYGLTLMVEALTQGLGGFGRAEAPTAWGASFMVQALDPEAFAGLEDFTRETAHVARLCKETPPRPGAEAVRLPGEAALARKRRALDEGVMLYPGVMPALEPWARRLRGRAAAPDAGLIPRRVPATASRPIFVSGPGAASRDGPVARRRRRAGSGVPMLRNGSSPAAGPCGGDRGGGRPGV
jgi:LDH2 family malate/lactate/ureidoglycolate dehydrogenase